MNAHRARRVWVFAAVAGVAGLVATQPAHAIRRCEVLKRAQAWVDDPNAWYSYSPTYTDPTTGVCCYRPDCSGMVSAVWGLDPPGRTTYHFAGGEWDDGISYVISGGDLKPGDALNYPGVFSDSTGHIMLYVSGNFFSGNVEVMEEYSTGYTAERRWRYIDTSIYLPIRYQHIEDDGPEICNGVDDDCDGQVDEDNVCELDAVYWGAVMYAPARTTDVDGDGKADVCGRGKSGLWCHLSKGSSWGTLTPLLDWTDAWGWDNVRFYSTIRFGDIDGDQKADVCARGVAGIGCWKSDGKSFAIKVDGPPWSDTSGWGNPQYYSTIRLLDMNGDGKDDLCARAAKGIVCHISSGDGFGPQIDGPEWSDGVGLNHPRYYSTLRVGDIDGNGKDDLCMRVQSGLECYLSDGQGFPTRVQGPALTDENGWGRPEYYTTIRSADINGDGKDDICVRGAAALGCYFSDANSFGQWVEVAPLSDASGWNNEGNYTTLRTEDINGDGAQDLCIRAHAGISCYLWNESGFTAISGPPLTSDDGWNVRETYFSIQLADINGDHKADLCGRHSLGWRCYLSQGSGFAETIALDDFRDENGWAARQFSSTVQIGGPRCIRSSEICNGKDDNCNGLVDEGCETDAGTGGSGTADGGFAGHIRDADLTDKGDTARPSDSGNDENQGKFRKFGSDDTSGCACRMSYGSAFPKWLAWGILGTFLSISTWRRRYRLPVI